MHYLKNHAPQIRGGFIHIQYIPEKRLKMVLLVFKSDLITRGLKTAAVIAANERDDIREIGGKTLILFKGSHIRI